MPMSPVEKRAKALRENLKRRKAQGRLRQNTQEESVQKEKKEEQELTPLKLKAQQKSAE